MKIVDFTTAHTEAAALIALQNYNDERRFVPALPPLETVPELKSYAENGLGAAAFEGDTMIGFLCGVKPFENAFGSTGVKGIFSPMGAHGASGAGRAKTYALLYQAAGEKWAASGASSHAICLYAHDREISEQFFRYGFGMRCIDAIRGMDEIAAPPCGDYSFSEPAPEDLREILPFENLLVKSYRESPFFMYREPKSETAFLKKHARLKSLYFTARSEGRIAAFIRAEAGGETFIQNTPGYLHVMGAYCLPEHRGTGVSQKLLSLLIEKLKCLGCTRLGVDYESINPSGSAFWQKYFAAYTCSVVRRIDEYAMREKLLRSVTR